MIKKCKCNHDYQDKRYGKKMRVHNKKADGGFVCTICRDEKTGNGSGPYIPKR
jgi:hypothetical protein